MNIEEAKAVLKLKSIEFSKNIEHEAFDNIEKADFSLEKEAIETVLAELAKQEKIINAMAGDLNDYDGDGLCFYYTESTKTWGPDRIPTCGLNKSSHCIECIKEYYEKKVSEEIEPNRKNV